MALFRRSPRKPASLARRGVTVVGAHFDGVSLTAQKHNQVKSVRTFSLVGRMASPSKLELTLSGVLVMTIFETLGLLAPAVPPATLFRASPVRWKPSRYFVWCPCSSSLEELILLH
jgi:hypothetical protein